MPIYEYACTECGERVELFQRVDEELLSACPVCGGKLRKMFSPVGIVLKGSGFYRTDSRAPSKSTTDRKREEKPEKTTPEKKEKTA